MALLLAAFILTPYKIAFVEKETTSLMVVDIFIDLFFLLDVFLNFFMAYYDSRYILVDSYQVISFS